MRRNLPSGGMKESVPSFSYRLSLARQRERTRQSSAALPEKGRIEALKSHRKDLTDLTQGCRPWPLIVPPPRCRLTSGTPLSRALHSSDPHRSSLTTPPFLSSVTDRDSAKSKKISEDEWRTPGRRQGIGDEKGGLSVGVPILRGESQDKEQLSGMGASTDFSTRKDSPRDTCR